MKKQKVVLDGAAKAAEEAKNAAVEPYDWLQVFVIVAVALVVSFTCLGRVTPVDGHSMEPTLWHGDLMLVRHIGYSEPQPGDIVVLTKAFDAASGPIVKRVVAVGGQRVDIDYAAGTVSVDGQALEEPYIKETMQVPHYGGLTSSVVPEGSVFVMGDNRNHSNDSRDETLGPVDERYILGKVELVFFPFAHAQTLG